MEERHESNELQPVMQEAQQPAVPEEKDGQLPLSLFINRELSWL